LYKFSITQSRKVSYVIFNDYYNNKISSFYIILLVMQSVSKSTDLPKSMRNILGKKVLGSKS